MSTPPPSPSLQLLEVTILSAQDLPSSRRRPIYAVVFLEPSLKLSTHDDPSASWNDRFLFRLDPPSSALTVYVLTRRKFLPNKHIGTSRLLLSTLRHRSTHFFALQIRHPSSLRPLGILNLGVVLLDPSVPAVPLFLGLGSPPALAYRHLMARRRRRILPAGVDQREEDLPVMEKEESEEEGSVSEEDWWGEELERKLERWKVDLSPEKSGEVELWSRRRSRVFSCFR